MSRKKNDCFRPGQEWLDTEGKPIQAHGFSVFYQDGVYYWYGENKERTCGGLFNKVWHWGVRCYSSTDLYNWEDKGLSFLPSRMTCNHRFIQPTAWIGPTSFTVRKPVNMWPG